ncbi:ISNCY family transposase [Endozoicomonas gorgoniicola]|uniref:ISNCY family transposase n=1 Tax=Endozoicomonas gorgoniicola TaxID=1234144 RepID=A0ABT3MWL0_9GAMM|nr:ISNCY family transposase [Endozoicomonas gorgoniicola]MCW7551662.1 ISNCY family transposase [Endozoicomonas gorgoniicola]MCW7552494.1 ISNCY family transposase [Endozoicomonas gorgoniicola]MCW7552520.1 ISNCY family transposase [Endozoicomonas gorgoniicola]MCW7552868.1 ISNCY family transposase [Endozoicomonas gorgoniicola]MCW7552918.1 ISNCY family transposase [Endozoicomonas gorgoniicola]
MRQTINPQMQLGEVDISAITFNPKSRDDIPRLLRGLQHIWVTPDLREQVFQVLESMIPASSNNGRPGMDLWNILVFGTLRLVTNCDYDRLQELANEHGTLRKMLGHGPYCTHSYHIQTLQDNISLFTPEILDQVNQIVVAAGHQLVKKKDEPLYGRADSFVVKTDVHFPTDISLLNDACRKAIEFASTLAGQYQLPAWRQREYLKKQHRKRYHKVRNLKHSVAACEFKQRSRQHDIETAHLEYIKYSLDIIRKAESTAALVEKSAPDESALENLKYYIAHSRHQINLIYRRVIEHQQIPHSDKVFSIFEPHTEWISKGKAGVPVELGLRVCVLQDQFGFTLNHHVMQKQTDDQVAVPIAKGAKQRFPMLSQVSYDKGFWSPANLEELDGFLERTILPKKGRLSAEDKKREHHLEFTRAKRKHSAVESDINALEANGLDKCPDKGIDAFKRYVALAVVGGNLKRLGRILQERDF